MSKDCQAQNGHCPNKIRASDLDAAIAQAQNELRQIALREAELRKVIEDFSELKRKRLPRELFPD